MSLSTYSTSRPVPEPLISCFRTHLVQTSLRRPNPVLSVHLLLTPRCDQHPSPRPQRTLHLNLPHSPAHPDPTNSPPLPHQQILVRPPQPFLAPNRAPIHKHRWHLPLQSHFLPTLNDKLSTNSLLRPHRPQSRPISHLYSHRFVAGLNPRQLQLNASSSQSAPSYRSWMARRWEMKGLMSVLFEGIPPSSLRQSVRTRTRCIFPSPRATSSMARPTAADTA